MIYTVTLNPSVDYIVRLDTFLTGTTNRTTSEEYYIGGKGLNVSYILNQLDVKSTALGFCAGFTGSFIENQLRGSGISSDFIKLKNGISRINIKVKSDEESEINAQGPYISESALEEFFRKIDNISNGDTIVIAGSIPKSLGKDTYARILSRLKDKNVRIIVDAENELLLDCLPYKPFLIKPNRRELSQIFGVQIDDDMKIMECAESLMKKGAQNVIVSLGGDGAFLFAENGKMYRSGTLKQKVLNTVGAGDSMVAGFIAGYDQTGDFGYALKLAAACGNATAFSPGLADRNKIEEVLFELVVSSY
ncbi:MAG: 1-phosphofructokinase [Clostridia bacterium]|nr:1-phosphofructokinase [Clostridia bacterium]